MQELKTRYYFWTYSISFEWQPVGKMNGYDTVEELKEDNEFMIKNSTYKILEAKEIQGSIKVEQ